MLDQWLSAIRQWDFQADEAAFLKYHSDTASYLKKKIM